MIMIMSNYLSSAINCTFFALRFRSYDDCEMAADVRPRLSSHRFAVFAIDLSLPLWMPYRFVS